MEEGKLLLAERREKRGIQPEEHADVEAEPLQENLQLARLGFEIPRIPSLLMLMQEDKIARSDFDERAFLSDK